MPTLTRKDNKLIKTAVKLKKSAKFRKKTGLKSIQQEYIYRNSRAFWIYQRYSKPPGLPLSNKNT